MLSLVACPLATRRLAVVLGVVLAASPAALTASPAAAGALPPPLTISPAPGTPDASPQTQISILGVAPSRILSVAVTGSVSGPHPGRLRPYSRRRGASFLPARSLAQGESVRVVVRLRARAPVRLSFGVARLGPIPPLLRITTIQPSKLQHFVSEPGLTPPAIATRGTLPRPDAGVFLTPIPSPIVHPESNNAITISPVGPGGPMILDRRGNVVWFDQLSPPQVAINLRLQRYGGRRVLTWWQGPVTASAFGLGEGVIADTSYRTIATVHAGNGYAMDLHEFQLTPAGDALFTINSPVLVHLPGTAPGAMSPLLDAIVEEVDIRSGLVTWEWHSLGHIPLADSYATPANSADYDAFHINSIQPLAGNRVLVSARDTSAIYEIDRASARILWTLGGRASSFRLGPGARFWFQHDARLLAGDRVSMFDDEAGPPQKAPASRALILRLDMRRRVARVLAQYRRSGDTSAQSEGSVQTLAGGDVFAGFGSAPFFSQFAPGGRLLFDASLPQDDGSYRAYRFPWSATPVTHPAVAARRTGAGAVSVYASWNGATAVARWQVLAGTSPANLSAIALVARAGFETRIDVSSAASLFAVRAVGRNGRVLAASAAVGAS